MPEIRMEPDVNKEITGQPSEYILDRSFDENGETFVIRPLAIKPQIGREVQIHNGVGVAEITAVEEQSKDVYKISLKKIR